jgi:hypothetical protein
MLSFLSLAILMAAWARKLSKLFNYLKANRPSDYETLGKPHLLFNNTPKHTAALLKFIHSGPHDDPYVERNRRVLLKIFWLYLALFFYCVSYIFISAFLS